MLRGQLNDDAELVLRIRRDFRTAGLPPDEVAMLEFVELLTLDPGRVTGDDVRRLRDAGFTEVEIFDIVLLTSYRNFMVRIASGLGVALDEDLEAIDPAFRRALLEGSDSAGGDVDARADGMIS